MPLLLREIQVKVEETMPRFRASLRLNPNFAPVHNCLIWAPVTRVIAVRREARRPNNGDLMNSGGWPARGLWTADRLAAGSFLRPVGGSLAPLRRSTLARSQAPNGRNASGGTATSSACMSAGQFRLALSSL